MSGRTFGTHVVSPAVAFLLAVGFMLPAPQAASAAVVLSQNFDSGCLNVGRTTVNSSNPADPNITLVSRFTYPGDSTWGWLSFRADGVANTTPQFRFIAASTYVTSDHRYVYSYDQRTWTYFDNGLVDAQNYYHFSNNTPFTQNTVYVAQAFPYPTWQTDEYVAAIKTNPFIFRTASGDANLVVGHTHGTAGKDASGHLYYDDLGRTIPSLPLYGFGITDANATGHKAHIVIQCGNHSCETQDHYTMEGMVLTVLSNTPEGDFLRKHAVFFIYPQIDPEGRWAGFWRSSPIAPANDHNRYWADYNGMANGYATPSKNPEIHDIEQAERIDTGGYVDYFFDHHGQGVIQNYPVVTQETLDSLYIVNFRLRDPANSSNTIVWGPITMAEYWAADPLANGGLAATYSLTPETGMIPNLSVAGFQQMGANYMLALYDTLLAQMPANTAPTVTAGDDQATTVPAAASLLGTVSDDGLPISPGKTTAAWSQVSGPGVARFADANAPATTVSFSRIGTYVLRLTASDSAMSSSSDVTITLRQDLRADFNGDGHVDGVDFLAWQSNYASFVGGKTKSQGDANGDGIVDGVDFLIWQNAYGYEN